MESQASGGGVLGVAPGSGALTGRLARSSVAAFAIHVAGAGLTYCAQLVLARIVGVDAYGIYAYVFAWMTILAYFAALGFDVSLLRLVPAYRAQHAWPLLRGVIRYAEWRAGAVGCGVVLIGSAIVMLWPSDLPRELTSTFIIGFVLVPVWALLWIRSSVVRAYGGVVSALAPDRIVRDGVLLILVGAASLGRWWRIDAASAMLMTLASSVMGLLLVSLAAHHRKPATIHAIVPAYDAGTWRRIALPLVMLAVAETGLNRTGAVMLGWLRHTSDAGIYALAFNIAFMVVLPRTAVNALFAPIVSDLFVRNDRAALQAVITRTSVWTLLAAACIALPLGLLADPLLAWFGAAFQAGVPAMRILLIGQVIGAGAGSQLYLMTMTGHERSAAILLILCAAGNVAVSAVAIVLLGVTGAAIATTAALVVWNLGMGLFIWRKLHLIPGVLAIFRLWPGTNTRIAREPRRAAE
ncbi:oligosaccharide flippase family protein [Limobrevibacterium gyesilva]|uniref:Oligosaccharide flippase family protein n=1 Tax=Limobrevibacterium gyesilva TaxID=2991712 RepID=A0AA41YJG2_9PROT|nr:oligosaccharide flippase family protein [Limobrevibacterium gyesilva]MCW3474801.1 oligosaccharide flippase family protein [Limobrevibacterium gyesilva]